MKKVLSLFIMSALIFSLLVSCTPAPKSDLPKPNQSWYSHYPPPQPFRVSGINEAVRVISEKDYYKQAILSECPEIIISSEDEDAYEHMICVIKNTEYFPMIDCFSDENSEITFFPEQRGEDIGIRISCILNDLRFDYFVYYIKTEYLLNDNLKDYWTVRFGKDYLKGNSKIIINHNNQDISGIKYKFNGQTCAAFLFDKFDIRIICKNDTNINDIVNNLNTTMKSFSYE